MKKYIYILCAVLAMACSKEQAGSGTYRLAAGIEDGKVRLKSGTTTTVWSSGDAVSVFYRDNGNSKWEYVGEDQAESGELAYTGWLPGKGTYIYGLYPFNANASLKGSVINTTLPATQSALSQSFGTKAVIMTARATGSSLAFKYAVGLLRLKLTGGPAVISKVTVEGGNSEVICGPVQIDMSTGSPVTTVDAAADGKEITTKQSADITISTSRIFFICVPPGTYPRGFIYKVYYADGNVQTIKDTRSVTLGAGEYQNLEVACVQDMFMDVYFRKYPDDGTIACKVNPFTATPSNEMIGSRTEAFYLKTDAERKYPFYFYVSAGSEDARLNINSVDGLQIGGTAHDYILLPPVEGKRLTQVQICSASSSKSYAITEDDDAHTVVSGGEKQTGSSGDGNAILAFNLSGTETGTAYRIDMLDDDNGKIKFISLCYSK